MNLQRPFQVTTQEGKSHFLVMQSHEGICGKLIMAGANARDKFVIRLAGGCGNLEPEKRAELIPLMVNDFDGFGGILFTGATREIGADGMINPMITDVPGLVAQRNPACISLGTVPKTFADYTLTADSRLTFSEDDSLVPAPGLHRFLIVQEGFEIEAGWDADLPVYFQHMEEWENMGFKPALVSYNGGGVTMKEITGAAERGWNLFLYKGSGRKTDEFIDMWESDSDFRSLYPDAKVTVVQSQPGSLREALIDQGFISVC